jgi:hypothetical protein
MTGPSQTQKHVMELPAAEALERELQAELDVLRKDPNVFATYLRSNRQNLYKGNQLELLKDDLKTKVLLATHDGRKACLAAISALDKTRGLKPFGWRDSLSHVAADTCEDIAQNNATQTSLKLMDVLGKYAKVKSSPKAEYKADRIVIFGPDLYTAKNIVASLLINDGVPDAKARNVLLSDQYTFIGAAVRKHPSQEYVVCLAVSTPILEDI